MLGLGKGVGEPISLRVPDGGTIVPSASCGRVNLPTLSACHGASIGASNSMPKFERHPIAMRCANWRRLQREFTDSADSEVSPLQTGQVPL